MELSVVIPAHNERENLPRLIGEIRKSLAAVDHEIIVVDDGSTDGTREVLERTDNAGLRVIRHRECCGQTAALLSGVRAARYACIATLDGDGQNDPADIPTLYGLLMAADAPPGLQAVIGLRRRRRDNVIKRMASKAANGVRRRLLRDDTADTGCGLKVFYRDAFLALPYFDHMHRFLPALWQREGAQVLSVEVNHRPRLAGKSHYGIANRLWVGIVDLLGVYWLRRRNCRPRLEQED